MSLGEKFLNAICNKYGHEVKKDKHGCARCKKCGEVASRCKP